VSSAFQQPRSSAVLQHQQVRTRETVQVENVVLVFRQVKAQLSRTDAGAGSSRSKARAAETVL
jgi:hypothetical protein